MMGNAVHAIAMATKRATPAKAPMGDGLNRQLLCPRPGARIGVDKLARNEAPDYRSVIPSTVIAGIDAQCRT
jgi:hypothetical protein